MTGPPPSREEQIYVGKEVAFYTAMVGAWINTRMERDKSVLTISVGAVAVLGTVATAVGVHGTAQRIAFAVAFLAFVASAGGAVGAFHWSAQYVEAEARREPATPHLPSPRSLKVVDQIMLWGMLVGLAGALVLGLAMGFATPTALRGSAPGAADSAALQIRDLCRPCCCLRDSVARAAPQPTASDLGAVRGGTPADSAPGSAIRESNTIQSGVGAPTPPPGTAPTKQDSGQRPSTGTGVKGSGRAGTRGTGR